MKGLKKQRGLKRYYKNLALKQDFDKDTWRNFEDPKTWQRIWHIHFDYWRRGNKSFKRRKPHLDKLFRHFELLIDKTKSLKQDFQLYTVLLDFDSGSDALFLHMPNPNNDQFPFRVSDLKLETTLKNEQLNDYIRNLEGYEKLYGKAGEAFCLIYKKEIGYPF